MSIYSKQFYDKRDYLTQYAARHILSMVMEAYPIKSVIDFGCGVGTWLKEAERLGASKTYGIEGEWVDSKLYVAAGEIRKTNLENEIVVGQKYDLAISLEVAEHINVRNVDTFIKSLCNSSDLILFSAAIKGQGGKGHVNEQNQTYWIKKFQANGYSVRDIIRKEIWGERKIPVWYRQNCFLFVKGETLFPENVMPYDVVHPDLFEIYTIPSIAMRLRHLVGIPKIILKRFY